MITDLEMRLKNNIWYSPLYIEKYLLRTSKTEESDVFEASGKYKRAREMRLGRILALCLYALDGCPHFVTIPSSEPPDLCILGKDFVRGGPPKVYSVEVTTYINDPSKGIIEHLKDADKIPSDHHNFKKGDIILVNIGMNSQPDYEALNKYLKLIEAPYDVWMLQDVSRDGTSRALFTKLTPLSPEIKQLEINLGLVGLKLQTESEIERIKINITGPSKSGLVFKKDGVEEEIPWE